VLVLAAFGEIGVTGVVGREGGGDIWGEEEPKLMTSISLTSPVTGLVSYSIVTDFARLVRVASGEEMASDVEVGGAMSSVRSTSSGIESGSDADSTMRFAPRLGILVMALIE